MNDGNPPEKNEDVRLKILVCYYQPWKLPKENIFFPIQAGKAVSGFNLDMQGDDTGDNISDKNATFSEFTAWYWAWKNIKLIYPNIEYIGLSHYRRFFALDEPFESIIFKSAIPEMENYDELIKQKLQFNDVILAKHKIFGESVIKQFHTRHNENDLVILKNIIHDLYPEYDDTFTQFMENNNKISLYCMFIARYEFLDKYFNWLFPILYEAEKRIDMSGYDNYQKRILAFLAERLLNIYVLHNKLRIDYEPNYFIRSDLKTNVREFIKLLVPFGIIDNHRKKRNIYLNNKFSSSNKQE